MALSANSGLNSLNAPLQAKSPQVQQKQYRLTMFGNTFYGAAGTPKSQYKNANGVTAGEHSRQGVLAHERAHDSEAKAAGLSTSGPVLQTRDGLTVAGRVNLSVPQLNMQRAMTDSSYLANYKRQSLAVVNSAHAPEHAGIGGYGQMSGADHNVAAIGRANLAKASQLESRLPALKQQMAAQQQKKAAMGYHPSLMKAHIDGSIV